MLLGDHRPEGPRGRSIGSCNKEPLMDGGMSRGELRAEYRRRVFRVFNGDEWMCSCGDMYFMQPEAANATRDYALSDVIDDLVVDFDGPMGPTRATGRSGGADGSWPQSARSATGALR